MTITSVTVNTSPYGDTLTVAGTGFSTDTTATLIETATGTDKAQGQFYNIYVTPPVLQIYVDQFSPAGAYVLTVTDPTSGSSTYAVTMPEPPHPVDIDPTVIQYRDATLDYVTVSGPGITSMTNGQLRPTGGGRDYITGHQYTGDSTQFNISHFTPGGDYELSLTDPVNGSVTAAFTLNPPVGIATGPVTLTGYTPANPGQFDSVTLTGANLSRVTSIQLEGSNGTFTVQPSVGRTDTELVINLSYYYLAPDTYSVSLNIYQDEPVDAGSLVIGGGSSGGGGDPGAGSFTPASAHPGDTVSWTPPAGYVISDSINGLVFTGASGSLPVTGITVHSDTNTLTFVLPALAAGQYTLQYLTASGSYILPPASSLGTLTSLGVTGGGSGGGGVVLDPPDTTTTPTGTGTSTGADALGNNGTDDTVERAIVSVKLGGLELVHVNAGGGSHQYSIRSYDGLMARPPRIFNSIKLPGRNGAAVDDSAHPRYDVATYQLTVIVYGRDGTGGIPAGQTEQSLYNVNRKALDRILGQHSLQLVVTMSDGKQYVADVQLEDSATVANARLLGSGEVTFTLVNPRSFWRDPAPIQYMAEVPAVSGSTQAFAYDMGPFQASTAPIDDWIVELINGGAWVGITQQYDVVNQLTYVWTVEDRVKIDMSDPDRPKMTRRAIDGPTLLEWLPPNFKRTTNVGTWLEWTPGNSMLISVLNNLSEHPVNVPNINASDPMSARFTAYRKYLGL